MKKNVLFAFALGFLILNSCQDSKKEKQNIENVQQTEEIGTNYDEHNSQNSVDFEGTYVGNLPSGSGPGMKVTIVLLDTGYEKTTSYAKAPEDVDKQSGKFTWDKTGSIITLEGETAPNKYIVGEDKLIQLDIEGKEIKGELSEMYVLTKK